MKIGLATYYDYKIQPCDISLGDIDIGLVTRSLCVWETKIISKLNTGIVIFGIQLNGMESTIYSQ